MVETHRINSDCLPPHWIGVEKDWEAQNAYPWERLVSLPPSAMRTHTLLIGATGSGKTTLLHHLIAQAILLGHSFCVLDMRGDLVSATVEMCAGRVDPELVRIVDLREKRRSFGFDPLFGAGEPYFRALGVLDVVASENDSWGPQLEETLRMALMLLAETGEPLTKIERLFHDRGFLMSTLNRCSTQSVLGFWQRFDELSADRKGSLAMPVLNKVSLLLATATLRNTLGHPSPMDLGAHLDRRGSVTLISLAVDEMHGAGRMLGRMLLASICREIFSRVHIAEGARNPVQLFVDEFEHFGTSEFEDILAEGRRYGLSVILAHQTLAQLTPKLRSMILGNVGTKFVFRNGREDGAVLSRDLTGDPRLIDFAEMPVGEAMMWRRSQGVTHVEVNEPIVQRIGSTSPLARKFLAEVYRSAGAVPVETPPARAMRADEAELPDWIKTSPLFEAFL